jgi:hypothetical protein
MIFASVILLIIIYDGPIHTAAGSGYNYCSRDDVPLRVTICYYHYLIFLDENATKIT